MANMKQNLTCSRSKPPPARSSGYSLGRVRGQMNVDHPSSLSSSPSSSTLHTMQAQERYNTHKYKLLYSTFYIITSPANYMSYVLVIRLQVIKLVVELQDLEKRVPVLLQYHLQQKRFQNASVVG
jgi:hypothetical protein